MYTFQHLFFKQKAGRWKRYVGGGALFKHSSTSIDGFKCITSRILHTAQAIHTARPPPPPVSDVTTELLDRLIRACSLREITGSEESPLEPELASEDNIPPSLELASKESIPLNFPFLSSFAVFSS